MHPAVDVPVIPYQIPLSILMNLILTELIRRGRRVLGQRSRLIFCCVALFLFSIVDVYF